MHGPRAGALAEWRQNGTLPIAAAIGYATCVIHIYGLGVYVDPIAREFGWSRATVTFGLTISTIIQAIAAVPIGALCDRIGPRRLALVGMLLTVAAFANLSNATGTNGNWYLSWVIMSAASLPVQATIWTNAVATRFSASRGLALAVAMCGASLALAVYPVMGAELIAHFGWRQAMRIEALIWIVLTWPIIFIWFRGARDVRTESPVDAAARKSAVQGVSMEEAVKTSTYWRLVIASLFFTFTMVSLNFHFPLLLQSYGYEAVEAAAVAALIGGSSLIGRLGTGFLLDRMRPSLVGAAVFALPVIGCAGLLLGGVGYAKLAALLFGLTLGAEIDVLVYLTTVYFGMRHYGTIYGGVLGSMAVGTAFGPWVAAQVFDHWQGYDPFLWATVVLTGISSLALLSLPRPKVQFREVHADG